MGSLPRMLAKPYALRPWRPVALRPWRPVALCIVVFVLIATTLFPRHDGPRSGYGYPRYIYHGISNFLADRVYENTLYSPGNEDQVYRQWNFSNPCRDFPDTSDVLLVMKTGATEVFDKVPTHLLTSLQCMPDFLLFSDMEQQIGQWHIYNALDSVADDVKHGSAEFDLYKAQIDCPVSQKACVDARGKDSAAWALDKYKFLHIIQRAWEMRPNRQWYVFAEADTYVFWPNLVTYLRGHLDSRDPLYVGSVSLINNFPFAHGGSGYVISGVAVKRLVENHGDVAALFDTRAKENCCGDLMLALALHETEQVRVKQAHPMFNGEKPVSMPFGNTHWCEPIFTMHHMNSEEISAVWQYEQTRKGNDILIMKDLFETFVARHLKDYRSGWDNLADDVCYIAQDPAVLSRADKILKSRQKDPKDMSHVERAAHQSHDACARVCEYEGLDVDVDLPADRPPTDDELQTALRARQRLHEHDTAFKLGRKCFQWRYHDGVCCTSKSFKLGTPRRASVGEPEWHSGWYMKGIEDWIESRGECSQVAWRQIF